VLVRLTQRPQIFSLISQDDNKISRVIAEQSTLLAIASKRDSTAMKTLALLTMLFLPATFVAVRPDCLPARLCFPPHPSCDAQC
jgi:hypothetical protein